MPEKYKSVNLALYSIFYIFIIFLTLFLYFIVFNNFITNKPDIFILIFKNDLTIIY
jgi:hypothetical protein